MLVLTNHHNVLRLLNLAKQNRKGNCYSFLLAYPIAGVCTAPTHTLLHKIEELRAPRIAGDLAHQRT